MTRLAVSQIIKLERPYYSGYVTRLADNQITFKSPYYSGYVIRLADNQIIHIGSPEVKFRVCKANIDYRQPLCFSFDDSPLFIFCFNPHLALFKFFVDHYT